MFDLKSPKQTEPFLALDYKNNILVTVQCHGPPIRFTNLLVSQMRYITSELKGLVDGTNTVVVIGIWSHFSTFPVEVYIRRLLTIQRAVEQLLTRAPGTLVIIRTANPKALSLYETLTNSDWFSLQHVDGYLAYRKIWKVSATVLALVRLMMMLKKKNSE
ncbi:NXPE family member 3-like [Xiphophorus maculatus]|uniref:NXPE family member 3-like n=1 Tax=Xiphophorus maculatus TaxID=8083 RepID=UPI000C6E803C|nr:NXPE family member 3-like [Xiphophorus maculatus]